MQVLFIHQNFPGQYGHLAPALLARGDQPVAIEGPTARPLPGGVPPCHPWAEDVQTKCLRAEAMAHRWKQQLAPLDRLAHL